MNYIAATATFGLVFVLAYWIATKVLERRVSVMERIGGGAMASDALIDAHALDGAPVVVVAYDYPRTVTLADDLP